jgi:rare lipoprotein A
MTRLAMTSALSRYLLVVFVASLLPGMVAVSAAIVFEQPLLKRETQKTRKIPRAQKGLASFYGAGLQGEKTASGEIFDMKEMVAAHPSYPMGTIVRITNLENKRTLKVRVNDRGPTAANRKEGVIIDVSRAAARALGFVKAGRVKVRVEVVTWGNDAAR